MACFDDSGIQVETSQGHDVRYWFSGQNNTVSETWPWTTIHDFHSDCWCMPTSWQLAIKYKQGKKIGKVPCSVFFTRYDSVRTGIQVNLSVSFHDANGQIISSPKSISKDGMMPGDAISCSEFGLEENETITFKQEFKFQVSIKIRFCHPSLYLTPKRTARFE